MSVLWLQRPFSGGSRELGKWVCYFVAVTELIIEGSRLYGFSETVLSPNQESFSREAEDLEPGSCIHGNSPPTERRRDSATTGSAVSPVHMLTSPSISPTKQFFFTHPHILQEQNYCALCFFPLLPSFGLFLPVLLGKLSMHHCISLRGSIKHDGLIYICCEMVTTIRSANTHLLIPVR